MTKLRVVARAAVLALALAGPAWASTPTIGLNQWYAFDVDDEFGAPPPNELQWFDSGDYGGLGLPLTFMFTLSAPGALRVVDGGFAGDTFRVLVNGMEHVTSPVPTGSSFLAVTFDQAWALRGDFSRLELALAPGSYAVTGYLLQPNTPGLNVTSGAVQVVPEPGTWLTLLAGLGLLGLVARRRA